MATVIESGVGAVNYGKQTAKGTIATAASTAVGTNRIKHVGGGFKTGKVLSSEEYSDGNRVGSPTVFTNFTGGQVGTVMMQAQPENIGLFWAQILGSDIVTGASDPYTHTITDASSAPWGTWWVKTGSAVGPVRQAWWDSKISKLTQSSPRDRNVVHLDADIASLKPAEKFTTDPAKTEDASDPYLLTEATGGLTFDSVVVSEIEDAVCEMDAGITPFYGDSHEPLQLIDGKGRITRSFDSIVTDDTLLKYYKAIYNTTTPADGDRPVKDVFYAAATHVFTRSLTRTATLTSPRIAIDPANFEELAPLPEGGKRAIRFGGQCLKDGATRPLTVTVLSADATSYV